MGFHNRAERAKIFTPFDPLKGFREALAEKERITVPQSALSDEMKETLDLKIRCILKNDMITVIYYNQGEYVRLTGIVSRIDPTSRLLKIVNTTIHMQDIYDIQSERIARLDDISDEPFQ